MAVKLSITMSEELLKKVDTYKDQMGLSRSAVIQFCIIDYFKQRDAINLFPELIKQVENLQELSKEKQEE